MFHVFKIMNLLKINSLFLTRVRISLKGARQYIWSDLSHWSYRRISLLFVGKKTHMIKIKSASPTLFLKNVPEKQRINLICGFILFFLKIAATILILNINAADRNFQY